jgi:uracil-DNA glycosylase family 4
MSGFFTQKQTESITRPTGKAFSCSACGLYKNVTSPKMKPFGNFKKGIMNIGEFPSELDDERGQQWQGKEGRILKRAYEKLGIDLFEDCINLNAVNCSPDEKPTNNQLDCCRSEIVLKAIQQYKPKVIVLFGNAAVYSIIGNRWKKDLGSNDKSKRGIIDKWRGFIIPDQDLKAWICPVFSPTTVLTEERDELETVWKLDLTEVVKCLNKPFPVWKEPEIEIITDLKEIEYTQLGSVKVHANPQIAAFDYETTGLKPHAEGHKIICCSIADSADHVYVFMMPETRRELQPFLNFLSNEEIKKIAANIRMEHVWSQVKLKTEVKGWIHDTMQAAHILDNRTGITSLKFQNYVNFGIVDYDSEISPYLRPKVQNSANDINQIEDLLKIPGGKEKLLKYCAYDSINEFRLYMKQIELISPLSF